MKRFGRLPSPAMVAALGALIMSVGGNVTAAVLITSADIQDNTIRTVDIRDGTIKSVDVANGSLTGADVTDGSLTNFDIRDGSLRGGDVADGSLFGIDIFPSTLKGTHIADRSLTGADVAPGSLTGSDVADGSLTGADVAESTFVANDAHDFFNARCDPTSGTYIHCGSLSFNRGHAMPVIAFWNYGFGSETDDNPNGECQPRLDGAATGTVINLSRDNDDKLGATPILDVLQLGAGNHTISLWCAERVASDSDFVVFDLRIGLIELGLD